MENQQRKKNMKNEIMHQLPFNNSNIINEQNMNRDLCNEQSQIDVTEEKPEKKDTILSTQWQQLDDTGFVPSQITLPTLPAGKYIPFDYGTKIGLKQIESLHDTIIEVEEYSELLTQINTFWASRDKYKKYGIIHKRGFLLHGVPGVGKTALLNLIADKIVVDGGVVVYSANWFRGATRLIRDLSSIEPNRKILFIIEDIDEEMEKYQLESDVLAFLDGADSVDNLCIVCTTNHLNKVPDRIKNRPSRIDLLVEIKLPSDNVRRNYLMNKIKPEDIPSGYTIETLVNLTAGLTFASIKEFILCIIIYGYDVDTAIKKCTVLNTQMGFKK